LNQLNGINIKDVLGSGMVAKLLMVTGEAKDIADAQSYGTQYITLNGYPVPVSADYLHHRVNALLLQKHATSQARHAHDGSLIISDISRINAMAK
jgi:hypothetical protein